MKGTVGEIEKRLKESGAQDFPDRKHKDLRREMSECKDIYGFLKLLPMIPIKREKSDVYRGLKIRDQLLEAEKMEGGRATIYYLNGEMETVSTGIQVIL